MDKTTRIRELNDAFRKSFVGGKVVVTEGVDGLSDSDKMALLTKVRTFDDFHRDNDPHHEHDFVRTEHDGITYYGKIDYYAKDMEGGSEDPADPLQTVRVLTIMRADEY
ncbi:hypothetical protein V1283_008286 [Bradyrhizobium sp. AZCC 2262]|uniref:DUF3768 domain-containing protein n=1 Tax=Bradyrhizobium sp. AZCC 2262 TaxID=3117022 RepID=UPI002FF03905